MRKQNVLKKAQEIIQKGNKPSVQKLCQELDYPPQHVHRCLNALEKDGKVETYSKEVFGNKNRMVSVKRD